MKHLLVQICCLLSFASVGASFPNVLMDQTTIQKITVDENTFIPNVQGYACPVPAINIEKFKLRGVALDHNLNSFGVKPGGIALAINNPNMAFCSIGSAQDVFGEEFVEGAEIELEITIKREIVVQDFFGAVKHNVLREVITSQINGHYLSSVALVDLGEL